MRSAARPSTPRLRRLDTDYLDLLLLHQPYGKYIEAWKAMEEAVAAGKIRSIGLSNFNQAKTQEVLDMASITPAVMQVEMHPYWNQHGMKAFLKDRKRDVRGLVSAWPRRCQTDGRAGFRRVGGEVRQEPGSDHPALAPGGRQRTLR